MRRACGEDVERPSDLLSIFVLKALKPGLYRDKVDHRVVGKVQHEIVVDLVPVGAQRDGEVVEGVAVLEDTTE